MLALRLEHRFDKREILAMYLSLASYGNQVVGAERASQAYFGRSANMLTAAQAAFLAGLPQRPSTFNPLRRADLALRRQRTVIARMEAAGFFQRGPGGRGSRRAPGIQRREEHIPRAALRGNGLVADAISAAAADRNDHRRPAAAGDRWHHPQPPPTARSPRRRQRGRRGTRQPSRRMAGVGGIGCVARSERDGAINGPLTPRQPGSALKPFTYALAFEDRFTPATVLADVPSHFPTADSGILYSPRNYDGRFRGPLLARRALAGSENVPAVSVASELGVPALLRFLMRAGLTTSTRARRHYGLGLTLGNAEVRLDELDCRLRRLCSRREWLEPAFLRRSEVPRGRQLVSNRTAFWITDILSDAEAREFIFGRGGNWSCRSLSPSRPAPRRRITTTGRSATPLRSRLACGSATSTARRCGTRAASPARRPYSTMSCSPHRR